MRQILLSGLVAAVAFAVLIASLDEVSQIDTTPANGGTTIESGPTPIEDDSIGGDEVPSDAETSQPNDDETSQPSDDVEAESIGAVEEALIVEDDDATNEAETQQQDPQTDDPEAANNNPEAATNDDEAATSNEAETPQQDPEAASSDDEAATTNNDAETPQQDPEAATTNNDAETPHQDPQTNKPEAAANNEAAIEPGQEQVTPTALNTCARHLISSDLMTLKLYDPAQGAGQGKPLIAPAAIRLLDSAGTVLTKITLTDGSIDSAGAGSYGWIGLADGSGTHARYDDAGQPARWGVMVDASQIRNWNATEIRQTQGGPWQTVPGCPG